MRALIVIALVTVAPAAFASAPAGVWSVPTGVTVSGADSDTPSVVITGVFTVHTGDGSEGGQWGFAGFEPTAEGYMHYVCKSGDKDMCLLQWADITAAVADKACVGWGENVGLSGVVHATGTPLGTPDQWNLAMGVVTGFTPCQYVESFVPPVSGDNGDVGADVADPAPDVPPVQDTTVDEVVDATRDTGPDSSVDDATGPIDLPDTSTADTSTADATSDAATDVVAGADTAKSAEPADDGCTGGPLGLAGALAAVGLLIARRARGRA